MTHARSILAVAVAALLVVGMVPAPAAGQELVTVTVTVETNDGVQVAGANLTATWDGGSVEETTAANGKAFIDVPEGAAVEIAVDHPEYIRNYPVMIEEAAQEERTVTVYPRATTTVEVTDEDGPVDDASVTLFRSNKVAFAEQTEEGTISTGDLEAGKYLMTVEKPGYYTNSSNIVLDEGDNGVQPVFIEQGTVSLHLNVTDHYFDPPKAVAEVSVVVEGVGSVQTQSNGRQQINVPVNKKLTVRAEKGAYDTVEQTISTEEDERFLDIAISRSDAINVSVLNDQVVVGQPVFLEVVDEYDDPVSEGTVMFDGESVAQTDEDGRAQFTIEEAGNHTISVTKDDVDSGETVVTGVMAGTTATTTTETTTTTTTKTTETTTITTTNTTETTSTSAPIPGFGVLVGLLGVILGLGLAIRRRTIE